MSGSTNSKIHGALLSVSDVAVALAISERTVRRMIAVGEISIVRLGRSVRVRQLETNVLFVGEDGITCKAQSTLSQQITKKVKEHTGLKFNAHLIRHVASFLFLNKVPGGHHVMRLVLGHKSVETLIRAYSGAESKAAHALYDGVIRDLRTRHAPSKKRGHPAKPFSSEMPDYSKMPLPDHGRSKNRRG